MEKGDIRDVFGFTNYTISLADGSVFNKKKHNQIAEWLSGTGYPMVALHQDGVKYNKSIHRLMITSSTGKAIEEGLIVNHIDGNKQNRELSNLEVTTYAGNAQHAHKMGLIKYAIKPVCEVTEDGKVIAEYESMTDAAEDTGIPIGNISKACSGKGRRIAGGKFWRLKAELGVPISSNKSRKAVQQLDKDTRAVIATFEQIKLAAKAVGGNKDTIKKACVKDRVYKDYRWTLVEHVEQPARHPVIDHSKWVHVEGCSKYKVSRAGEVYSLSQGILMAQQESGNYLAVHLVTDEGNTETFYIQCLVAAAYIPRIPGKTQANHKDRDTWNNNDTNLEWVTNGENARHAHRTGDGKSMKPVFKLSRKTGEVLKRFDCIADAVEATPNANRNSIRRCCQFPDRDYTSGTFKWRFAAAKDSDVM